MNIKEKIEGLTLCKSHFANQSNQEQQNAQAKLKEFQEWLQKSKTKDKKLIEKKENEAKKAYLQYISKSTVHSNKYIKIGQELDKLCTEYVKEVAGIDLTEVKTPEIKVKGQKAKLEPVK